MERCGLNDGTFKGQCESCGQRLDCMMSEILLKLQKIEAAGAVKSA